MKKLLIILAVVLAVKVATAADNVISIIDVRRSLPMEPTEKSTREFYINAGSDSGLKNGAYVDVVRIVQVQDPTANKPVGVLTVPIGKVHLVHVEKTLSVARVESELTNDERPVVEYETIMIGDQVDLRSLTAQKPAAPGEKKKTWL